MRAILENSEAREGQQAQGTVAGLPSNVEIVYKNLDSVSAADCSGAQVGDMRCGWWKQIGALGPPPPLRHWLMV